MRLIADLRVLWRRRPWRIVMLGVAVGAAAVALAGGFQRAASRGPALPESPPGARIENGAFAITPLCAWSDDLRPGRPEMFRGQARYLMLRAKVENLGDTWMAMQTYLAEDLVWLADGRGNPREPERITRADDLTLDFPLQPGLPVVVELVWDVASGHVLPPLPVWGVYGRRRVERSYLTGEDMWVGDEPRYRLPVPLSDDCRQVTR